MAKKEKKNKSPELSDKVLKIKQEDKSRVSKKITTKDSNRFLSFLFRRIPPKKSLIITVGVFVLALIVIALNIYFSNIRFAYQSHYAYPDYEGPILDTPSPLTGVMTTKAKANQKVVSAMIENHPASRPQSGLSEAGLVYEAQVEGGITRFLAFYLEKDAKPLGPVRSARSYYLAWVKELNSFYAHVGGSADAINLIGEYQINDLDQFYNSSYFWRDSSRYSPHNVYTTTKNLREAGRERGYSSNNDFESWKFKEEDEDLEKSNLIKDIEIDFSGPQLKVEYVYQSKANAYKRYLAGSSHKDLEGDQIRPTNIIVQIADQYLSSDGIHQVIETTGSGTAYIFSGGGVEKVTWSKESIDDRTKYFDSSGKEFEFNRGPTWVHLIPTATKLDYN
jgi:hypothetical protein